MESSKKDVAGADSAKKILELLIKDMQTHQAQDQQALLASAYRRLAKIHHPDKNPTDPNARENFALLSNLNQTWKTLCELSKGLQSKSYSERSEAFLGSNEIAGTPQYEAFYFGFLQLSAENQKYIVDGLAPTLIRSLGLRVGQHTSQDEDAYDSQQPEKKQYQSAQHESASQFDNAEQAEQERVYNALRPEDKKRYRNKPTSPEDMQDGDICIYPTYDVQNSSINLAAMIKVGNNVQQFFYGVHSGEIYYFPPKENKARPEFVLQITADTKLRVEEMLKAEARANEEAKAELLRQYKELIKLIADDLEKMQSSSKSHLKADDAKQKALNHLADYQSRTELRIAEIKQITPKEVSTEIANIKELLKGHLVNVAVESQIKHVGATTSKVGKFFKEKVTSSNVKESALNALKKLATSPKDFAEIQQKIADHVTAQRQLEEASKKYRA